MRVLFTNLGCKLNQAELERMAREFVADGHEIADSLEEAELHVVNSCSVTVAAARASRKWARRGRRRHATLATVLTGCYVESDREEAAALAGVDLIVGNAQKHQLLERVYERFPEHRPRRPPAGAEPVPCTPNDFSHARALVKIEDGCNMPCSFCIIPSTRGPQRSRPARSVVSEIDALVASGYREVILTGVQISSYRDDGLGLYELVERILAETPIERLRLSSIAPWRFDERLLSLLAGDRVCRHIHLSLQSGSTATLKRMRRPYDTSGFARLLDKVRSAVPGVAVTTDVIVGFPGETGEEFEESLAFVDRSRFARVHAFPYSARPGTEAATLADPVPEATKRRRMRRMLEVSARSEDRFHRRHVGGSIVVLWEGRRRDGLWWGTSGNYLRATTASSLDLERQLQRVRVEGLLRRTPPAVFVGPPPDPRTMNR